MKTFIYFFQKNNLSITDEMLTKFKLNFKKAEIAKANHNNGINGAAGVFFKLYSSDSDITKIDLEKQQWNFCEEIDGIKLYIGWWKDEFEEITSTLSKLKRSEESVNKYIQKVEVKLLDDKIYDLPAIQYLPQSFQYNPNGELVKVFSKRFRFLSDIGEKYIEHIWNGTVDEVVLTELYTDISILFNVFYHINAYDLFYSGLLDDISVIEIFNESLEVKKIIDARNEYIKVILEQQENDKKKAESQSEEVELNQSN